MAPLVLNPHAQIFEIEDATGLVGYRVTAPVRGRGARIAVIGSRSTTQGAAIVDPDLFAILQRIHTANEDVELSDRDEQRLAKLGLLIEPGEVSTPVMYACTLELDGDASAEPTSCPDALIVNPSLQLADQLQPPEDGMHYDDAILARWARGMPVAWVTDWRTGAWYPYQLGPATQAILASLRPGLAPGELDPAALHVLTAAGIIVPRDPAAAVRQWADDVAAARACYREHGYAVIRALLPPLHLAALARYYRALIDEGFVAFGDGQVTRRYGRYQEEVMVFFHLQLCRFFSRIVDDALAPSYSYLASYRPGAVLERHVDREACEHTASLLVDFSPYRGGPSGWNLYMERNEHPTQTHAVDLAIGDAVIYRGRELAHFRHPLPDGCTSTSFFLHYLPNERHVSTVRRRS